MVDKSMKDAYLWYSGATDKTGTKLAEALGIKHGRNKPPMGSNAPLLILGWGAKIKEDVNLGKVPALNHPNMIRVNRDKLGALTRMQEAKVNVAPFCTDMSPAGMKRAGVTLPVIGRTKFHQGGKGFWNCPTMTQVTAAANDGAQYFQKLIEINEEYRLHVVAGKVIYVVKKAKRTVAEMEEAYIKHEMDRQKAVAEKNNDTLDEATLEKVLARQAKTFAQNGPNELVRSNKLGWKFVSVKNPDKAICAEAVKALKAIGLDFGAVDACIDVKGKSWIIEVNTGPGLEETPFNAWVEALTDLIIGELQPKSIMEKLTGGKKDKKAGKAAVTASTTGGAKKSLTDRLKLAQEMVEATDTDEEADVLDKVFFKMFGK